MTLLPVAGVASSDFEQASTVKAIQMVEMMFLIEFSWVSFV